MRPASRQFYLAVFALLGPSHSFAQNAASRSEHPAPDVCAYEPQAMVSDACTTYGLIDSMNTVLKPSLKAITQTTDFFAYYRLNLFNRECPFWSDSTSMCGNIACSVQTIENEADIPEIWRAEELGKLEGPKAEHPGRAAQASQPERPLRGELGDDVGESCVVEYDDECEERDYCVPEDERAGAKGDYVSLVDNPERFTGYAGPGARQVWDAIYRENCFTKEPEAGPLSANTANLFASKPAGGDAANAFRSVMLGYGGSPGAPSTFSPPFADDSCLEKRVFHRIISGMHASISTHLCWDHLNQTTGLWGPNQACYDTRLAAHPERISNIYFNYALVARAVAKIREPLSRYTYCTGDPESDTQTKNKVIALATLAAAPPLIFDESTMFADAATAGLKADFRHRFRNVSRMMDCVGCDKCRLWGKLQTAGYGAALKVLFEYDEGEPELPLRRTELVALFNTLDRISASLTALKNFALMGKRSDEGRPMNDEERLTLFRMTQKYQRDKEDEERARKKEKIDEGSFMDIVRAELSLVWRAYILVLKSWVRLPPTLFKIAVLETSRLWNYFLGLPVGERTWEIKPLSRDEL
ncbi:MAG: endoplasmic oxidoreductin-1 [Vezdaea aestivalis]|nr:MAG: endoplasmic oxidoreductin-1 [Vezdaea aestivalis]